MKNNVREPKNCIEKKAHLPPKNRVGGFSDISYSCTRSNWSETQYSRPEKEPTPTTITSGVPYYGYRFYNPDLGRWINRDPIGTQGGRNLLAFLSNNPIDQMDHLGLCRLDGPHYVKKGSIEHRLFIGQGNAGRTTGGSITITSTKMSCGKGLVGKTVTLSECYATVYILEGQPSSTLSHEMSHFSAFSTYYNALAHLWSIYSGLCRCPTCDSATASWVTAAVAVRENERDEHNASLDCADYPPGPRKNAKCQEAANLRAAKATLLLATQAAYQAKQNACK